MCNSNSKFSSHIFNKPKMHRAIFLDRDGTLNKDEKGYTHKLEDFELFPDVISGLAKLTEQNYKLFVISNQSGVGRGYYSERDVHKFNLRMSIEFEKNNIVIEKYYFCPHGPEINCNCRKPFPKFVKEAEKDFNLDLTKSFVIGDHPSDMELAINSGCKGGIYLLTGHGQNHIKEALKINSDYIARNFEQAVNYILSEK